MTQFKKVMLLSGILGMGLCTDAMGQDLLLPYEDVLLPEPMENSQSSAGHRPSLTNSPGTITETHTYGTQNHLKGNDGKAGEHLSPGIAHVTSSHDLTPRTQTHTYGAQTHTARETNSLKTSEDENHHH